MSREFDHSLVTPAKTILVESKVESYQSENENNSNKNNRGRNQSMQNIRDDLSERSEASSKHSVMENIRKL